jgi:hypothetical protein
MRASNGRRGWLLWDSVAMGAERLVAQVGFEHNRDDQCSAAKLLETLL